ncbi:dATP/dGTP pyrophosphohydrolase domain-containing protein [Klebsiella aerogenes]|uniref:dATP/dGTP pyrophosphohydrolase domain-containing protein n=1 Tax=Klebsiella aerogenes TaxID=548 RepID=UPI003C6EC9DE
MAVELLAAMDSEPVAWTWHYREQWHVTNDERRAEFVAKDGDVAVLPLYRHAQTASEREQVRRQHAEWSQATFGNVGPVGPLKHLSKEALEAAAEPDDLGEWADMQFLLWDAQRRAGITDEQITQAMIEKLAVNKQREWPEPKDGEPRLHIKAQPAPVVPDFKKLALELVDNLVDCGGVDEGVKERYLEWAEKTCRAAMLQAEPVTTANKLGNYPVIPNTWIPVSERMPIPGVDVLVAKEFFGPGDWRRKVGHVRHEDSGWNIYGASWVPTHWMPLPAAPQEVKPWSSHSLPVTRGDAVGCPFNREVKGE